MSNDNMNSDVIKSIQTTINTISAMSEVVDAVYLTVADKIDDATRIDLLLLSNALHTFLRTVAPEKEEKKLN